MHKTISVSDKAVVPGLRTADTLALKPCSCFFVFLILTEIIVEKNTITHMKIPYICVLC